MDVVSEFLQREYANHPGSITLAYAGEIGLNCVTEGRTATGLIVSMTRDFVLRYNTAMRGMSLLEPPDAATLWRALRPDIEAKKIPGEKGVADFDVPNVLAELDKTHEGIRFEYDLFPGYTKVHRPVLELSVMQNLECTDWED